MKAYLISKERLLHHIEYDIRKSALGILNWYVDYMNLLNIIINVRGINYLFIDEFKGFEDIELEIRQFLTPENHVLSIVDLEPQIYPEEEKMPKEATMEEYFQLK